MSLILLRPLNLNLKLIYLPWVSLTLNVSIKLNLGLMLACQRSLLNCFFCVPQASKLSLSPSLVFSSLSSLFIQASPLSSHNLIWIFILQEVQPLFLSVSHVHVVLVFLSVCVFIFSYLCVCVVWALSRSLWWRGGHQAQVLFGDTLKLLNILLDPYSSHFTIYMLL